VAEPVDATVCGLLIEGSEDFGQPVAALVVVKLLEEAGVRYCARATDGLTSVEALGMARTAMLKLERGILKEDLGDDDD
jgi:hypothetical protein